ncbi:MAG TPA: hypothetical protein VF899_22685 [Pyrinomonadaceae bacterium]
MNCQGIEEIIDELARDHVPDQTMEGLHKHALIHLDDCAVCVLRLRDERALTRRLDEMAREMKSSTAPARVEEQLVAFFRQRFSAPVLTPVRAMNQATTGPMDRIGHRNRWIMAAAAVLFIVLGIAGLSLYVSRHAPPRTSGSENLIAQDSPKASLPTVDVGTNKSPTKPNKKLPESVRRTSRHRGTRSFDRNSNKSSEVLATTASPIANDTDSEVATQFMPLGYTGPINLQDGGQLVRVELPRSAMWSMGLPVNMDRYSERVKADVLLGADGLARAIRFVQ